jgi:hypothetical protein
LDNGKPWAEWRAHHVVCEAALIAAYQAFSYSMFRENHDNANPLSKSYVKISPLSGSLATVAAFSRKFTLFWTGFCDSRPSI